jgi:hypothetical protein
MISHFLQLTILYWRVVQGVYRYRLYCSLWWKVAKGIFLWAICRFWTIVIEVNADRWRVLCTLNIFIWI